MSQNVIQSPSNASPAPNLTDFTALISALQETTQALCNYSQTSELNAQNPSKHHSKSNNIKDTTMQKPRLSKCAKRKECYKEFCYNRHDSTAFTAKEIAQTFKKAYSDGCFRDEIRYYHVPANSVRYEYNLLCQEQQENILDLLSTVYNELELRRKLISCIDKDKDLQDFSLAQLGDSILQPLKLLRLIQVHLKNFKLVHKTMLPLRHS